jgi:hypothetical protein
MCGAGGVGSQSISFATKEIRTPKATSNKSTLSDPPPQTKNQKNQRGVYERKHTKQRIITTPFLNFEQMIKGSVRMKETKKPPH